MLDDSQPWVGQIDGVAAASWLRLSTSVRTSLQAALEALEQILQQAEGVFRRAEARRHRRQRGARGRAAHRAVLHEAGSLSIEFCSDGSSAAFAPRSDIAVCSAMIWPASGSVAAR